MLQEWLEPMSLADFSANVRNRHAHAMPGSAHAALPLLDWRVLDEVLRSGPRNALVVAQGHLQDVPVPRSISELRRLMKKGLGITVRRAEECDAGLCGLAVAFSKALAGQAHVQLFVTPGRTHGFAWHYDDEDVFVVQTAGVKDYYFRENTLVALGPTPPFEFSRMSEERSPLQTARLIPGDWLYIPRLWWHMARSVEDALSISVGVR